MRCAFSLSHPVLFKSCDHLVQKHIYRSFQLVFNVETYIFLFVQLGKRYLFGNERRLQTNNLGIYTKLDGSIKQGCGSLPDLFNIYSQVITNNQSFYLSMNTKRFSHR